MLTFRTVSVGEPRRAPLPRAARSCPTNSSGRHARKVADDTVVREDLRLPCRETPRRRSGPLRRYRLLDLLQLVRRVAPRAGGGAMMTVGNVERRKAANAFTRAEVCWSADAPDCVATPSARRNRTTASRPRFRERRDRQNWTLDRRERRSRLRAKLDDVARPVVFLVGTRRLVLLD